MDDDEEESSGYESDQPASRAKQSPLKKGGLVKKKTLKAIVKQDKKASRKRVVRRYFKTTVIFIYIFRDSALDMAMARMTKRFSNLQRSLGAKKLFMEKSDHSSLPKWMSRAKEGSRG